MSKKILIVTSNFFPEISGISVYSSDLARLLTNQGFEVTVITGFPHYPMNSSFCEHKELKEIDKNSFSATIIRQRHYIQRKSNAATRAIFELSIFLNFRRKLRCLKRTNFDAVISIVPTIASGLLGLRFSKSRNIPFGLIVQDLSSFGAKESGITAGKYLFRITWLIERVLFRGATSISCISETMMNSIALMAKSEMKLTTIYNYNAKNIAPKDRSAARKKLNLSNDSFLIVHTGNMGSKQGLENVIRAAEILSDNSKFQFFLIGHGNQEQILKEYSKGIENISFISSVSDDDYVLWLAAADLLLVNEKGTQIQMSLPSKLVSYLFSCRPVIAAVPYNGATARFLDNFAVIVESESPSKLADQISILSSNPDKMLTLASLGYGFAERNLGIDIGHRKYLNWVRDLIGS